MSSYLKFAGPEWPFIGLRPFQYEDHEYFFGREKELNVLEPQVAQRPFVAIVGGSGSGKSSLISAGLRPRLEKVQDHQWKWIEMRPADAPVRKLAQALADLTRNATDLPGKTADLTRRTDDLLQARADRFERVLTKSSFGIAEALTLIPRRSAVSRVLLLVDQFEELFRFAILRSEGGLDPATRAERRDEATAFVRLLLAAAESPEVSIHVVITMRSDFIGDCARFHGLPEAVSRSQFLVPGMTRDQREDVIRKPLKLAEAEVDPYLVQRALNDTNDEPDQLPILQHAMMRCWERAFDRRKREADDRPHLTIDDYKAVGGVERALSVHANEILKTLASPPGSKRTGLDLATKRIFQALTETDQEGRSVRRPQRFGDLVQYVTPGDASKSAAEKAPKKAANKATRVVIDRFASHDCSFLRVIPPADANDNFAVDAHSNIGIADDSIIDVGHEALIRRWDKLKGEGEENWIRDEQGDAEQYRGLLRYADAGATIPPEDLTVLEDWWSKRRPSRFWAQRYTKHTTDNFEKIREVLKRSRAKANAAIEEHQRYESRVIGIVANAVRNPRRYNGAADSLAMALNKPPYLPNVEEYVEVFYNGLSELREKRRIATPGPFASQIFALSFSPTGKLLAAAVPDNLLFFDTDTGELVHSERTPGGWVLSLRWSPDGKRIYVGTQPVGLILAACSIENLRKYFADRDEDKWDLSVNVGSGEHPAGAGAWSHDGKWILVAGYLRPASVWDASKQRFIRLIRDKRLESNPLDCLCSDLAASPDGERIALGVASGKIHIFNACSNGEDAFPLKLEKSLDPIDGTNPFPYSLVFDPQNPDRLLAAYLASYRMASWKIDENVRSTFGEEESGPVWRVAFDPKGKFVAAATADSVVRIWPWPSTDSDLAVQLRGHRHSVFAVDISPENGDVASASLNGTIRLWAKDSLFSPTSLSNSASMPAPDKFSIQNSQISVTASRGKQYSRTLPQDFGEASAAAVSANGVGIAVVPRFGRPVVLVKFRDYLTPVSITLSGVKAEWTAVAFIENDTRIAAKTKEGKVFAWPFYSDVRSLEQLAKENLPLVREKNGVEKRLEVPGFFLRKEREPSPSDA
jgi:WD40 repeat protein